jgi:hypothetical protein
MNPYTLFKVTATSVEGTVQTLSIAATTASSAITKYTAVYSTDVVNAVCAGQLVYY